MSAKRLENQVTLTLGIYDLTARRLAREAIDKKRDLYIEIVDKLQEASERLNVGEGDYIDE